MRLTRHTDYAMRVLLYLGEVEDRLCSIGEIAKAHRISHHHLTKVVHGLVTAGYVESVRGRGGGIRLARPARQIGLGDLVRRTEESFALADCPSCGIASGCRLRHVLDEALQAFLAVLDEHTLADLLAPRGGLLRLLTRKRRDAA